MRNAVQNTLNGQNIENNQINFKKKVLDICTFFCHNISNIILGENMNELLSTLTPDILIGGFIMSLGSNYDLVTNLSASLTCVSNVGPGLGSVGPVYNYAGYTIHAKLTASFLMLFGRLELLPLFILFTRSAWHKY